MRYILSILALHLLICLGSAHAANRVALVIGVDQYATDSVPDLDGAVRDARLMSEALKKMASPFEVQLLEDPSLDDALDGIDKFMSKARSAECAMFFFAGHGIEYHGENFLLTSDSNIADNIETSVDATKRRLRRKMLSLNLVMDEIELTQADLKLIILDACRDNPIPVTSGGKTRSLGGARGLARVSAPLGMLVSYSADAGEVANDGLFTEILTSNLVQPGLSVMEVFAKTREEVNALSTERNAANPQYMIQLPAEYNKLGLKGIKFVFNDPTGSMPPPTPPKPAPTTPLPDTTFTNVSGMKMVRIDPGEFRMGDLAGDGNHDEHPVRNVSLSSFHLCDTEVTQEQWKALMATDIHEQRRAAGFAGASSYGQNPESPIYYVSFDEAVEYCRRLSEFESSRGKLPEGYAYRLPTEAQWEYACRAGSDKSFEGDSWDIGVIATYESSAPVRTKKPNAFSIYDMQGNIWEWCQDFYQPNYNGLPSSDPQGPKSGDTRVFRGGSWMEEEHAARASSRGYGLPDLRHRSIGFRVALVRE